ncbi:putative transcription factor bHLH66-like [Capsicum annuum]|nr:putative transcription factor bHLH66-like [Capsicum annuum]
MALEAYSTSQNTDKIHTDVLSQARTSCYKARDAFYSCMEKESSKKPTEIATVGLLYPVECKKTREEYVKQCRPTWVKHFDRQYCAKKRVQRLLDDTESRRGIRNSLPTSSEVAVWTAYILPSPDLTLWEYTGFVVVVVVFRLGALRQILSEDCRGDLRRL